MKSGKLAKLAFVTLCVMGMVLKPVSAYADDVELVGIEKTTESLINAEATSEAVTTPEAEATPEAEVTPEAEATPEAEITPEAEATPEAIVTPEAGATPEAEETPTPEGTLKPEASPKTTMTPTPEASPKTVRMFLLGASPDNDEINIAEYSDGIVIDSGTKSNFNGKTITGIAGPQANLVIDGVEVELTIKNLTIDRAQEGSKNYNCDAIYLKNGAKLILTLESDNRLVGSNSNGGAGIRVEDGNTLIITENSSGTLEAVGGNASGSAAGIGAGNCGYDGTQISRIPVLGTIEIRGGTINAIGGTGFRFLEQVLGCAGIGCSAMGESGKGSITISGGNVTATGGYEGAGIGGGSICSPNNITINGGVIIANAGQYAAAIGSGCNSGFETIQMGAISITGGKVTANGNIGYGNCITSSAKIEGGSVEIKDNAVVTVSDGEINPRTVIEEGHVTQRYSLTLTVMDPSYTTGTMAGHITIGNGENSFSKDITYNLEDGKAVANIDIETILYGEQPVKASIEGTELEEKKLVIGIETDLIYGNDEQDYFVSTSGDINCRYENGVLTISGNGSVTVSMAAGVEWTSDSIFIDDEADIELTIKDITVDTTGKSRSPIAIGRNNPAICKIIPVGRNTLKRCDFELAAGVIEASDGSELIIGGCGTLNLQGMSGTGTRSSEVYAAGIRAINAEVIIEENPTLVISNPSGDAFSGILSKTITINGGRIDSRASGTGQGIGIPYDESEEHVVKIIGGTMYVEGGNLANWLGAITNDNSAKAVISGGSVNMNKLSKTDKASKFETHQPVNAQGEKLYCTTITVGKAKDNNGNYTLSKGVKVTDLTVKDSAGSDYQYGIEGMYTDADAKIYLWLPAGAVVSKVETECGAYEGNCTTNTSATKDYKGNSFGTANAEFTLAPESDYTRILPGDGTEANPYELSTLEELEKFRDLVNDGATEICGFLVANIDAKGKDWTPIGTEDNPYQGTFDGNGKKITELSIPAKDSDYDNKGFFGVVKDAYIKNLNIAGNVGENERTGENAKNYGMIAGKACNSIFEGCINSGSIYGGQNAAGICGWGSHCTFKKCTNNGNGITISSYKSVCGIVYDGDNSCTVENCVSSMYSNSVFGKMNSTAGMSDCYTIGGKNHINCLSLAGKYDSYEFVKEDADYYGHKCSDDNNYAGYKADGTKVTENWRNGKIAYLLQGNQKELIWVNIIDSDISDSEKNYWPQINYTSNDANYRVYEVKKYAKCDKSDTPTVTYQNESGEDYVPTHSFTVEEKSSKALKTPGTCKRKAVYYYSCEHCGAVGKTDTFEGSTNPANHAGDTEVRGAIEAVHNTQTDGFTGDTYCLDCGEKISSGRTIKPTPHIPSQWKHDASYHWKVCTVEGCDVEIDGSKAMHSSTGTNRATCQKTAVCDKCGVEYGEKIPCSFTEKVKSEEALKTPATETTNAVYFYSCSMCGKVEKDDNHTFVDYRESATKPSSDDNTSSDGGQTRVDNSSSDGGRIRVDNLSSNNGTMSTDNVPTNDGQNSVDNTSSDGSRTPANNLSLNDSLMSPDNVPASDEQNSVDNLSSNNGPMSTDNVPTNDGQNSVDNTSSDGSRIPVDNLTSKDRPMLLGNAPVNDEQTEADNSTSNIQASSTDNSSRRLIVATTVVAGSGAAGTGAFFLFKRKRILEKILKNLFKK